MSYEKMSPSQHAFWDYLVIIWKTRTIYHEGDERSRTYPGHGYPAHTETIEEPELYRCRTVQDVEEVAKKAISENRRYSVAGTRQMKVETKLVLNIT